MDCRNSFGVTLVELLVGLAVTSIILALAIPSFVDFIRSALLTTQTRTFISAAYFSRTHALKRNTRVFFCVFDGVSACSDSGEWEKGWLVYADRNRNGKAELDEMIRIFDALREGYRLRSNISKESVLVFYPDGSVRKGSGGLPLMTFALCAPDVTGSTIVERSREVVINATGRMRLQKGRARITRCS